MNTAEKLTANEEHAYLEAVEQACERIAPTWPLDRWIAVNPWWGHRNQPVADTHRELEQLKHNPTGRTQAEPGQWQTLNAGGGVAER